MWMYSEVHLKFLLNAGVSVDYEQIWIRCWVLFGPRSDRDVWPIRKSRCIVLGNIHIISPRESLTLWGIRV